MPVDTETHDRVLVVTIRREEKRNAIDDELAEGISAALDRLDDDPELWVGMLTGTPTVFSAGSDLARTSGGSSAATARGGEYGVIRRDRVKPLIAAVEGPALGGGFEIVLACDLVVASRTASFGLPEVKRGLVPTCGGLFRSSRALPLNVAREMLLTGDRLDPERAYALGLVNVLAEPGRGRRGSPGAGGPHLRGRSGRRAGQPARARRRRSPSVMRWAGRRPRLPPTRSDRATTCAKECSRSSRSASHDGRDGR